MPGSPRTGWTALALFALFAPAACSPPGAPPDAPGDSTLVEVLVDLHLADARAEVAADVPPTVRDSVLARHGLDSARFAAELAAYAADPGRYADLYDRVIERLEAERLQLPEQP